MGAAMAVALLVAAVQARNVEPGEYDEDDQDRETLW